MQYKDREQRALKSKREYNARKVDIIYLYNIYNIDYILEGAGQVQPVSGVGRPRLLRLAGGLPRGQEHRQGAVHHAGHGMESVDMKKYLQYLNYLQGLDPPGYGYYAAEEEESEDEEGHHNNNV